MGNKLFAAAGGASVAGATPNFHNVTLMNRTALVYQPEADSCKTADSTMPAIFVLHGSGDVPSGMTDKGFENLADLHKFLVVYPDTKAPRADEWGYGEDIPYFLALLQHLQENYCLDKGRAFVCGHSAGATMALFLQNEMGSFCGAGAVEGAVGHLPDWNMSKTGLPSMVIWNHGDPVLQEYAPPGGEPAYYNLTVSTLRRHGSKDFTAKSIQTSSTITSAEMLTYSKDAAPELQVLSFNSTPGTHDWADKSWCTFSATEALVEFFLGLSSDTQTVVVA